MPGKDLGIFCSYVQSYQTFCNRQIFDSIYKLGLDFEIYPRGFLQYDGSIYDKLVHNKGLKFENWVNNVNYLLDLHSLPLEKIATLQNKNKKVGLVPHYSKLLAQERLIDKCLYYDFIFCTSKVLYDFFKSLGGVSLLKAHCPLHVPIFTKHKKFDKFLEILVPLTPTIIQKYPQELLKLFSYLVKNTDDTVHFSVIYLSTNKSTVFYTTFQQFIESIKPKGSKSKRFEIFHPTNLDEVYMLMIYSDIVILLSGIDDSGILHLLTIASNTPTICTEDIYYREILTKASKSVVGLPVYVNKEVSGLINIELDFSNYGSIILDLLNTKAHKFIESFSYNQGIIEDINNIFANSLKCFVNYDQKEEDADGSS